MEYKNPLETSEWGAASEQLCLRSFFFKHSLAFSVEVVVHKKARQNLRSETSGQTERAAGTMGFSRGMNNSEERRLSFLSTACQLIGCNELKRGEGASERPTSGPLSSRRCLRREEDTRGGEKLR